MGHLSDFMVSREVTCQTLGTRMGQTDEGENKKICDKSYLFGLNK